MEAQRERIRKCIEHPEKEIEAFCIKCNTLFCSKCQKEHITHRSEPLREFCERRKNSLPSVKYIFTVLKERRNNEIKKKEQLDREYQSINWELFLKEKIAKKNKNDAFDEEINRVNSIMRYLAKAGEEALTTVLKRSCERAFDVFNIEAEIRAEFMRLEDDIEECKRKAEQIEGELGRLAEDIGFLDYFIGGEGEYGFDDEKWANFALLNEGKVFVPCTKSNINCSVNKFCSCDDADKLFNIEEVMEKKLVDVGGGIMVSEPVSIRRELRSEGWGFFISLSHKGILAIYSNNNGDAIQFTDLNMDKQAELRVENTSSVAFYDDKIILLTDYKPLRETSVEEMFKECSLSKFRKVRKTGYAFSCADVSLLQETRVFYYRTIGGKFFSFNVDTGENSEIDVGKKIYSCASFTGIDCGVRAVFQDYDDKITYVLHKDNSIGVLGDRQSSGLSVVFPSYTNPPTLREAALKYQSYLMHRGKRVESKKPFGFEGNFSVVRIFRDIFLLYNQNMGCWVLSRIIIP